jgi:hypothetical protein
MGPAIRAGPDGRYCASWTWACAYALIWRRAWLLAGSSSDLQVARLWTAPNDDENGPSLRRGITVARM